MVPISQPLWAHDMVTQFTHYKQGDRRRFEQPQEMIAFNATDTVTFVDC